MDARVMDKYLRDFSDNLQFIAEEMERLSNDIEDADKRLQLESVINCLTNAQNHLDVLRGRKVG